MLLRNYNSTDCPEMAQLFYDTVHFVNIGDYTQEEVDVWADGNVNLAGWDASLQEHDTVIAVEGTQIVGFGDMDSTGYLDRLYIHKDYQKQGIATAICNQLEQNSDAELFITHASITAKPFFENRGYIVIKEQQVERKGILLTNYVMEKRERSLESCRHQQI